MLARYLLSIALIAAPATVASSADKPNILFILTDDQGWPTLGSYGNKLVPTPRLDRLAKEGIRFTSAYVSPQCTPTRAALFTGQTTARTRMWHVIPWYGTPYAPMTEIPFKESLEPNDFNWAKGLQGAGYTTACIGKWHLTFNQDGNYIGLKPEAGKRYGFDFVAPPGPGRVDERDRHVEYFTDQAIQFIDKNKDKPWFCYLAHHTIHGKVVAPKALVDKYIEKGAPATGLHNATYLAAIEHLDNSVGRLLDALNERKLAEKTLVVFLSDNGGVSWVNEIEPFTSGPGKLANLKIRDREFDNAPLRSTKGSIYEGGIRVPCIVRWPKQMEAGQTCDVPIQAPDWLPTLLEIAGGKAPEKYAIDGSSLVPLFHGQSMAERSLVWYAPFYELRWGMTPAAAVRQGKWKLIEFFGDWFDAGGKYVRGAKLELYDLNADIGESKDLAAMNPEKVKQLHRELRDYLKSVEAKIPTKNPMYDPEKPFKEIKRN